MIWEETPSKSIKPKNSITTLGISVAIIIILVGVVCVLSAPPQVDYANSMENISDVTVTCSDKVNGDDNASKEQVKYSQVDIKFCIDSKIKWNDVAKDNMYYNIKFYNEDTIVSTAEKKIDNNDILKGNNKMDLDLTNLNDDLPKNGTINTIIIKILYKSDIVSNVFESSRISFSPINLNYIKNPNPNYIELKPAEPPSTSTSTPNSSVSNDTSGNFGNDYKYCYSSGSEVYHTHNCGHLPKVENRIYSNNLPSQCC
jgi:hypothetical protein